MSEEILRLDNISFSYGKNQIIKDFSLSVERGSFTTLLGPSGCGKTTLLRIIAGFLKPSAGAVWLNGDNVTDVPVEQRKIGFVFQDYALFPHMTVKENLLFGFGGKEKKNQIKNMEEISSSLGLLELLGRYPHELSGGQQQRVALGRTLMMKPEIILMDEPLSSLDAKLRLHVREELMEIQKKIGITTVYVTHDQEEALSLSDKIAVMNEGNLLQYDSPEKVYFNPESRTAAEFTGMTNFLCVDGKEIMIRPEWFNVEVEKTSDDELEGTVESAAFLGGVTRYRILCKDAVNGCLTADVFSGALKKSFEKGQKVFLKIITSVCFN
ncbi:MAG: ABC transporter ATP-binding protein [Treponema sp.]|nr:ABC transporter ATP-binding protein [Treponema sp.]